MKFNKTVLAVAVAGIAAAPMMANASTTLSGAVQVQIQGSDDDSPTTNVNGEDGFEVGEPRIAAGDVLMGVAASQALNSGLTGYGSLRYDLDTLSGGGPVSADSVYVGIRGGFGDVRFGEVGNPGEYGQVAGDLHDMGATINQGISYIGSFGGATVGVAFSPATNQDILGLGAKFSIGGFAVGVGMQDFDESVNISVGASFSFAGASIAVAGATLEEGIGAVAAEDPIPAVPAFPAIPPNAANPEGVPATEAIPATPAVPAVAAGEETHIQVKVGYSIAGVGLGLTFSNATEIESTRIRFEASYDLGGGMSVSTEINNNDEANDEADVADWRLRLAKSF